ncbi:MAG: response regulator [Eubacteriales bacterium]|nr:response regulator [Eubacteriales bacterium]
MYRILIVDDEFLVRLGLKTTIDWEAHGYHVVGEAANGNEALEMVESLRPDIVLADIKMPFMDGLEFITRAKKINKNLSFIILTNYESFQYAKRAMELGVSKYLLKSEINADTLLSTLESVRLDIHEEVEKGGLGERERAAYLSCNLSKGQINTCVPKERLEAPDKGLFPESSYGVIKYYCNISSLNEQSLDMLGKTAVSLVEREFPDAVYSEVIYQLHYYITLICPQGDLLQQHFLEKSQLISRKLKYYFSVKLRGGISNIMGPDQIPSMIRQAELARQRCFFGGDQFIIFDSRFQGHLKTMENIHVSSSKIARLLDEGDMSGIRSYINEIFVLLKNQMNYSHVRHVFIDFLFSAKSAMEKQGITAGENLISKLDYDNWNVLTSIEEAENYICDIFDTLMQGGGCESKYSVSVRKSIAYIEEQYALNITLQDVADHVSISKNYLSMLFKQETGINFVTYLNQYRIEKAKHLLADTNMKIYEIADSIGFYSPYYFSKVFKEITKMQCKEYRDKYSMIRQEDSD